MVAFQIDQIMQSISITHTLELQVLFFFPYCGTSIIRIFMCM